MKLLISGKDQKLDRNHPHLDSRAHVVLTASHIVLFALVALVLSAGRLTAQNRSTGEIRGTVLDQSGAVILGSVVNFIIFVRNCPKNGIRLENICSSRSIFTNIASTLQGFQSMNPMEYLLHPLLDDGRIREPKSRPVLRAGKFPRQPKESGA